MPENTKSVFLKLSKTDLVTQFTFAGGSALSVYLNHRESEDIDLFNCQKRIDHAFIMETIKDNFEFFSIEYSSKNQIDLNIAGVKLTFFAGSWDTMKDRVHLVDNMHMASMEMLTAMKLNTLFLRAKFRDYYDLYVINKQIYSIKKMYDIVKSYMPEINKKLFQMAIIYIDDIEDDSILHLHPKYPVTIQEIQTHFENKVIDWLG